MKKLLGISLIAVLAVSPMMAGAANITTDIEPAADANGPVAAAAPKYALQAEVAADSTSLATAKYVKGAYNAAIKAINTVDTNAKAREGDLNSLTTTAKTDLVSAINEVKSTASDAYQLKEDSNVATNGNYISSGTGVAANLTALDSQAKANADAIAAEESRATAAESALTSAISAEESRATAAESALGSRIDSITSNYATKTGVAATVNDATGSVTVTNELAVSGSVTGNVPAMIEWGDSTAQTIALANGTIASGAVASGTITGIDVAVTSYVAGE